MRLMKSTSYNTHTHIHMYKLRLFPLSTTRKCVKLRNRRPKEKASHDWTQAYACNVQYWARAHVCSSVSCFNWCRLERHTSWEVEVLRPCTGARRTIVISSSYLLLYLSVSQSRWALCYNHFVWEPIQSLYVVLLLLLLRLRANQAHRYEKK